MAVYRHKPGKVEAVRWTGTVFSETPDWVKVALMRRRDEAGCLHYDCDIVMVNTPDGWKIAHAGDYVVRAGNGDLYATSRDLFERTFDLVR